MDRFQEMQVFVRIAERHSFTQAADDLQIPRATVTNLMKRMEERLGARLLERTTRTVRLTHDGEEHYRRCVRLIADLEEAEGSFRHAEPKGMLRVNLQGTLARHFVMPGLPAFLERHKQIELHIGEDDRLVDLVREGVDCVIRSGQPEDSGMIQRRLGAIAEITVASPAYLAAHGTPASPDALDGHQMIGFISSRTSDVLPLEFSVEGRLREIVLPSRIRVNNSDTMADLARLGFGLVQAPRYRFAARPRQRRTGRGAAEPSAVADAVVGTLSAKPPAYAATARLPRLDRAHFR